MYDIINLQKVGGGGEGTSPTLYVEDVLTKISMLTWISNNINIAVTNIYKI